MARERPEFKQIPRKRAARGGRTSAGRESPGGRAAGAYHISAWAVSRLFRLRNARPAYFSVTVEVGAPFVLLFSIALFP